MGYDLNTWWRDVQDGPLLKPFLGLYMRFMNLERGNSFPFYIYPGVKELGKKEDTLLLFFDDLVDIHELERNKDDATRTFYQRLIYTIENYARLQNDTVANLMFDTKLTKPQYDIVNRSLSVRYMTYMVTMTSMHSLGLMYLCYFFRYRKLTFAP